MNDTTTPATTGTVECRLDGCGEVHRADYDHDAQWGGQRVFVAYCHNDDAAFADYYTEEVVTLDTKPAPTTTEALAALGIELGNATPGPYPHDGDCAAQATLDEGDCDCQQVQA